MLRSRILAVLLILSGMFCTPPTLAAKAPRPHIVFLLADDLGWADVGFHDGNIATPNIDRLAKRGVQLHQFYVQPVCSPTRASLMTGRYPLHYGLQCGVVRPWASYGLPLDERLLPAALREAGYKTAIIGKWHLGHVARGYLPTQRGFDQQYGHYNGMLDYYTHFRDSGHDWHKNDKPNYDKGYTTDLIAREAVRVLAEHDKTRPLFLYVPFNAPHTPLQAPADQIKRNAHIKQKSRRIYAAMVTALDDAVGRIDAALTKHHYPRDNTLIVFCSDNGGVRRYGSNGPLRAGKGTLYEGGIRVPAVMVWKDVLPAGKIVNAPLHIVDLFPTLVGLAGGKPASAKPLDGKNAWPTITQGQPSPHDVIVHNITPFNAALRVGHWKLIHNPQVGALADRAPQEEKWELYNIRDDPSEKKNVAAEKPAVLKRLKARLAELRKGMVNPHIAPRRPPAGFHFPKIWGEFAEKP